MLRDYQLTVKRLRDYQQTCVDQSEAFFRDAQPKSRLLWAAPTGSGKSYCELALHHSGRWILSPRIEIILGLMDKLGLYEDGCTENDLLRVAWRLKMTTPLRALHRWLKGDGELPTGLIIDECHHDQAETYQQLHLALDVPAVGFTASPYRGTPQSTAALLKQWGSPRWMITYEQAAHNQTISMPICSTVPLVDDDVIKVVNGEFEGKAVESESLDRIEDAARLIEKFWGGQRYDRATIVTCPSIAVAETLASLIPAGEAILGDTPKWRRLEAFKQCEAGKYCIVHVNVVSEGIDLRLRRMIDLSPTLSPVKWVQQVGRITRPVDEFEQPPELIVCNRNLLRHAYILGGALPNACRVVAASEQAFGGVGKRLAGGRVFGVEGLGKLKGVELPLTNGLTGTFYCFEHTEQYRRKEMYAAFFHPLQPKPIWAKRVMLPKAGEVGWDYTRSKWELTAAPQDGIIGFNSVRAGSVTEKQLAWWRRVAEKHGLAVREPSNRQFQALPVLRDLGIKVV